MLTISQKNPNGLFIGIMMVDLVIPGYYKIALSRKNIMYAFNPKILYSEYV